MSSTMYFDMAKSGELLRQLWGADEDPALKRFVEEERELARRMAPIGPFPSWWRPFARRRWREAANKVHYGWAVWCMNRRFAGL